MKNIIEILKSQNIELTDEQVKSINEEVKANYKTIAEFERQKDKLDLANSQLEEVNKDFNEFKKSYDGVDVEKLKSQVDELAQQLADKDTDYTKKLNTIDLKDKLKLKLQENNCLDYDLAMTQFNIDELLQSKNQDSDIDTALKSLVENKAVLFKKEESKPITTINVGGKTGSSDDLNKQNALRRAMGLSDLKGE